MEVKISHNIHKVGISFVNFDGDSVLQNGFLYVQYNNIFKYVIMVIIEAFDAFDENIINLI